MFNFKMKKILAAGVAVLALSALSVTAFAASAYNSPAEAVAALTGKTVSTAPRKTWPAMRISPAPASEKLNV